jgi:preprotein translocase subunit Sss1
VVLKEVVINSGENPAWRILRKVWSNKDSVNKDHLNAYQCESYTRIELAADNIDNLKKSPLLKQFAYIFDSLKIEAGEDGKEVLPIFISETSSDQYFLKNPFRRKEYIKATKITGVGLSDGSTTTQYIGSTFQEYNFNDDWLSILEKDFISPIARGGLQFYKYYLVDSMLLDGKFCYEIKVIPKREQDLAFTGTIWITDSTFALKRISVEVGKSANINFIERIKIQQDLMPVGSHVWAPVRTRLLIDVQEPTKNSFGVIGKFYLYNKNWVVNQPKDLKFYDDKIERADDYQSKPKNYWEAERPEKLDPITLHIYDIVDSIKEIPKVKNYTKVGKILGTGYIDIGDKFQIGPWAMIYGYNEVEGSRFRLGLRTTYSFSKNWILKS